MLIGVGTTPARGTTDVSAPRPSGAGNLVVGGTAPSPWAAGESADALLKVQGVLGAPTAIDVLTTQMAATARPAVALENRIGCPPAPYRCTSSFAERPDR